MDYKRAKNIGLAPGVYLAFWCSIFLGLAYMRHLTRSASCCQISDNLDGLRRGWFMAFSNGSSIEIHNESILISRNVLPMKSNGLSRTMIRIISALELVRHSQARRVSSNHLVAHVFGVAESLTLLSEAVEGKAGFSLSILWITGISSLMKVCRGRRGLPLLVSRLRSSTGQDC